MFKNLDHLKFINENCHMIKIKKNNSTIKFIVEKKRIILKIKHINITYHFIRDKIKQNNILII